MARERLARVDIGTGRRSWRRRSRWLVRLWSRPHCLELFGALQIWQDVSPSRKLAYRSEALGEHDLLRSEQSLFRIRQELVAKQEEIDRTAPIPAKGWIGRVFGSSDSGLAGEMAGLQAMERQMARSLSALKKRKVRRKADCAHTRDVKNSVGPYPDECIN